MLLTGTGVKIGNLEALISSSAVNWTKQKHNLIDRRWVDAWRNIRKDAKKLTYVGIYQRLSEPHKKHHDSPLCP